MRAILIPISVPPRRHRRPCAMGRNHAQDTPAIRRSTACNGICPHVRNLRSPDCRALLLQRSIDLDGRDDPHSLYLDHLRFGRDDRRLERPRQHRLSASSHTRTSAARADAREPDLRSRHLRDLNSSDPRLSGLHAPHSHRRHAAADGPGLRRVHGLLRRASPQARDRHTPDPQRRLG